VRSDTCVPPFAGGCPGDPLVPAIAWAKPFVFTAIPDPRVSLDGLAATHDELRGVQGSFDDALSAIAAFRAAGVHVAVNTQISRVNQGELE
jgi:sulfatase maturation enzyme AslB (radical SAM superfamily)